MDFSGATSPLSLLRRFFVCSKTLSAQLRGSALRPAMNSDAPIRAASSTSGHYRACNTRLRTLNQLTCHPLGNITSTASESRPLRSSHCLPTFAVRLSSFVLLPFFFFFLSSVPPTDGLLQSLATFSITFLSPPLGQLRITLPSGTAPPAATDTPQDPHRRHRQVPGHVQSHHPGPGTTPESSRTQPSGRRLRSRTSVALARNKSQTRPMN